MAGEPFSIAEAPSCQVKEMDKDFQFLLCERCQADVPSPKLLPCLHNLCSQCLEESKPIGLCPICGTPHFYNAEIPERQENVFFANLQAKLSLYQKVAGSKDSVCDNCKKEAEFWCPNCQEFLCALCFQTHQRYLKRENHEAKPLKDLQAESCKGFLSTIWKPNTMFCSNTGHKNQMLSLYCRQCSQPMCTICALLDSKHVGQHCDIHQEIQGRQEELESMSAELKENKSSYDNTYNSLEKLVTTMEKLRSETRALIQQKIDEVVQMLREKGERFLAEVDVHHNGQVQDVKEKLQEIEGVVQRITSSQKLVGNMQLYASDQEVLEMHPFLKKSLAELKRKQPSTVDFRIEVRNFTETKAQLQDLLERVTKDKEAVPAKSQTVTQERKTMISNGSTVASQRWRVTMDGNKTLGHLGKSPVKRKYIEEEKNTQGHPKIIKIELSSDKEWDKPIKPASTSLTDQPGTSFGSTGGCHVAGSRGGLRENTDYGLQITDGCSDSSDPEDASLVNVSSEEESTDDETCGSILPLDINSKSPGIQKSPVKNPFSKSEDVDLGPGNMIYFDLKSLPGNILHLVALVDEAIAFSVMISSPLENTRGKVCEFGLDVFLNYLSTLRMPILVGYKLWSMGLPALLDALQKINKEKQFEDSILGFLDAFPLIKEKHPEISNYTLKNLDSMYLWGQLDNTKPADCARTLKDLCIVLEINPVIQRRPAIACSNLRCYSSLQPLLQEKVLSKPSMQTLALHNVSLFKLQSVYQNDPEKGLKKLCRYLNVRRRTGEKKIQKLSKIRTYFQNLPSS